ncbi:MAG: hypothetical protein JSU66_14675 [Deltaproteobacteria bacterium]|nr:MAG: hypothetical protein JSU66_14675 [Deltaproteobacteria bacterium]
MEKLVEPARAERLARAILSDLAAYNIESVRAGIENDDLFERLAEELDRARSFFEERVDSETARKTNAFDRAVVDILVFGSRRIASRIW